MLQAITHNLAAYKFILSGAEPEASTEVYEKLEEHMIATKSELLHLQKHPEVFPSKDIEEAFWQEVYDLCDDIVDHIIASQQAREEEFEDLEALGVELEHNSFLPVRDPQRKPWEQYLHNRVPGVHVDLSAYGNEGSIQIFPMAAVRIVMGMVEETRAIISDIESVSVFLCRAV